MRYYSSSSDFYYDTTASTLNYYITVNGETIYNGKAVKSPSKDVISIDVGKRVRDYIRINMPDFRDYDGVVVPHPEAMLVFNLYDSQSGGVLEQYNVRIDDTKEWSGEEGCLSEPINTHADPRQKIFYGYGSNTGKDIDIDVSEEPCSCAEQPLTFDIISGGTIRWSVEEEGVYPPKPESAYPEYSFDEGETWIRVTGNSITLDVNAGDRVMFKGTSYLNFQDFAYSKAYFNLEGNILSMIYRDDFIGKDTYQDFSGFFEHSNVVSAENLCLPSKVCYGCYERMFGDCKHLVKPPVLRARDLSGLQGTSCYDSMFEGCTSLTEAPELPSTKLGVGNYYRMFRDCTSLTSAPKLPAAVVPTGCYEQMFCGCTSLKEAPKLPAREVGNFGYGKMFSGCTSLETVYDLPATDIGEYCYLEMFCDCTSLTTPPRLMATTLAPYCYISMFQGCSSLVSAPALPATGLRNNCYRSMFLGCKSLTTAPELPATQLADYCYHSMFQGCQNLNYIKCMAAGTYGHTECFYGWVGGVSPSGTFVKNRKASMWSTGDSGIPSGWTVISE